MINNEFQSVSYFIKKYFKNYWYKIVLLIVISFISASLISFAPMILAPALDVSFSSKIEPAKSFSELNLNNVGATLINELDFLSNNSEVYLILVIVIFFLGVMSIGIIIEFLSHLLSIWITTNIYRQLQVDLFEKIINLDYDFFVNNRTSELTSRFINDAGEAVISLDTALRQALQSIIQVIIYGYLLFKTSPTLAFYVILISSFHLIINKLLKERIKNSTSDRFDKLADVSNILNETLSNIRVIKSFSIEKYELNRFLNFANNLKAISIKFWKYKHTETPLRKVTDTFALGVILVLAFNSLKSGNLTETGFLLFMIVVRQTISPISTFSQAIVRFYGTIGASKRIIEVLNIKNKLKNKGEKILNFNSNIEFKNVSFKYENDILILDNIDLTIKKGETIAIVGSSGAGKSTLIDLLLRLFDPIKGNILIDGKNIKGFSQKSYRKLFGVVPQESLLNHMTIAENISFGKIVNKSDLVNASKIANANDFINLLPNGYDTIIGERGVKLSGGQRQRIAIARAVYCNPEILVLDEATSSLDNVSEEKVQKAFNYVSKNRTAIIIAHRLSTIKKIKKIIVLSKGKIEAIGNIEYLLRTSKTFKKLYNLELK